MTRRQAPSSSRLGRLDPRPILDVNELIAQLKAQRRQPRPQAEAGLGKYQARAYAYPGTCNNAGTGIGIDARATLPSATGIGACSNASRGIDARGSIDICIAGSTGARRSLTPTAQPPREAASDGATQLMSPARSRPTLDAAAASAMAAGVKATESSIFGTLR